MKRLTNRIRIDTPINFTGIALMESEDARLIGQYLDGDAKAFETLVRKYESGLFTFLIRLVGDRQSAEDVMQETFLKLIKALPSYQERGKFSGWLFGIANNLAIDMLRRNRVRNRYFMPENQTVTQVTDQYEAPDTDLERNELHQQIAALIQELPEKQRQVFLLRQHGEMSFKEIAEETGEPLNTVLSHMHYAVKKLRKKLQTVTD